MNVDGNHFRFKRKEPTMPSNEKSGLDELSWKILAALQEDARLSFAALGRQVGLSPPAVAERVQKMEDAGIILGYQARIDPAHIGLTVQAIVHMQVPRMHYEKVVSVLGTFPEVQVCHRTTGKHALILRIAVTSMLHLEAFLDRLMHYGEPETAMILSTPISNRPFQRAHTTKSN